MAEQGCKLFVYGVDENLPNGDLQVRVVTALLAGRLLSSPSLQNVFNRLSSRGSVA
jgi:hypothetical protein